MCEKLCVLCNISLANEEIKDGLNKNLNLEIEEKKHITCDEIDKMANSKISQTAALYLKSNKRLCTKKLPGSKYLKPIEYQFGNCLHQGEENNSLRNNGL